MILALRFNPLEIILNTFQNFICFTFAKLIGEPLECFLIIFGNITKLTSRKNVIHCITTPMYNWHKMILMQSRINVKKRRRMPTIGANSVPPSQCRVPVGFRKIECEYSSFSFAILVVRPYFIRMLCSITLHDFSSFLRVIKLPLSCVRFDFIRMPYSPPFTTISPFLWILSIFSQSINSQFFGIIFSGLCSTRRTASMKTVRMRSVFRELIIKFNVFAFGTTFREARKIQHSVSLSPSHIWVSADGVSTAVSGSYSLADTSYFTTQEAGSQI